MRYDTIGAALLCCSPVQFKVVLVAQLARRRR